MASSSYQAVCEKCETVKRAPTPERAEAKIRLHIIFRHPRDVVRYRVEQRILTAKKQPDGSWKFEHHG